MAAVAEALGEISEDGELVFDVEGHGRDDLGAGLDLTRGVGWFTSLYPLATGDVRPMGLRERVKVVRGRREAVPANGVGYGLLRHSDGDPSLLEALRALPSPEVSFNYFGRIDLSFQGSCLFSGVREGCSPDRDPAAIRPHALDVSAGVFDGRMRILFIYPGAWLSEATVADVARRVEQGLQSSELATLEESGMEVWEV
jgi:non-ribosomal peptide synthase protein (TIGR01720 family)